MIRTATEKDIDAVEKSYTELLMYEKEYGGSSNWVLGVYPTRETAERGLKEGSLYVLEENGQLCASMVLNRNQPENYDSVSWTFPAREGEVMVIHTLCVPPSKAGKGYGKSMVVFALDTAEKQGCRAVRIDTFAGNGPASSLYRKLGFLYAGSAEVLHQGVIPERLIYFEKEI